MSSSKYAILNYISQTSVCAPLGVQIVKVKYDSTGRVTVQAHFASNNSELCIREVTLRIHVKNVWYFEVLGYNGIDWLHHQVWVEVNMQFKSNGL